MIEENTSAKLSAVEDNIASEPVINAAKALITVNKQAVEILALAAINLYCASLNVLFDNFKKLLHFVCINDCRSIT